MPGLEQLPFAEVWFREIDDARWREASEAALAIDKNGLEAWTTDRTPDVDITMEEAERILEDYITLGPKVK